MSRQSRKEADRQPEIFYCNRDGEQFITSIDGLVQRIKLDASPTRVAVCVIENISTADSASLMQGLDLDPTWWTLFDTFVNTESKQSFWKQHTSWDWKPPQHNTDVDPREHLDVAISHVYVDGMFEYHGLEQRPGGILTTEPNFAKRECFQEGSWPIQSTTRLSYCRLNHSIRKCLTHMPKQTVGHY